MRAHYLQHVPFEGLGSIKLWLERKGYRITKTPFFKSSNLPAPEEIDLLIIMGGPMSVNEDNKFPWLVAEKEFVRNIIKFGKPVLGICLGAQMIASSLGAKVYKNAAKEIGWFPIYGIPSDDTTIFRFPQSLEVFHWHGETFDLPSGATCLAKSEVCKNQAFQFGKSVIGLQFHLETTPESAQEIIVNCRNELLPSKYIQAETELLAVESEKYQVINNLMGNILTFLCSTTDG